MKIIYIAVIFMLIGPMLASPRAVRSEENITDADTVALVASEESFGISYSWDECYAGTSTVDCLD